MGKWEKITKNLPRRLGDDPGHNAKVLAVRDAMAADPAFEKTGVALAREFAKCRALREPLKQVAAKLQVQIDALELLLESQFENEGVTSVNIIAEMIPDAVIDELLEEVRAAIHRMLLERAPEENVRVQAEPYAKIVNPALYQQWCLEHEDIRARMTYPWGSTNSDLKALLEAGEKEQPGVEAQKLVKVVLSRR